MKRSTVISALLGLILGAGGVVLIASLLTDDAQQVAPTSTTSATVAVSAAPGPVWVDPTETVVGPAVIVPDSLRLEDDAVVFRYDMASLAPLLGHETTMIQPAQFGPTEIGPDDLDPVYPDAWTIVADGVEIVGKTSNPRARSARFAVSDGFVLSTIDTLRLDGYRIPVPVDVEFELVQGRPVEVAPGVSVSVLRISPQGSQTILQVEVVAADSINREHLTIEGTTSAWLSAVREAEGRPRYNLRHDGSELPDPLVLRARGFVWLPVDRSFTIQIEPGE